MKNYFDNFYDWWKNIDKYIYELSQKEQDDLGYLLRDVTSFFGYHKSYCSPSSSLLRIERKVDRRLRFNRSNIKQYYLKKKAYLLYLKYLLNG